MLWFNIENDIIKPKDNIEVFDREYIQNVDYKTYRVSSIINKVLEYQRSTK